MSRNDTIAFICIVIVMVLIVPTWFDYSGNELNGYEAEYYVYMLTDAITNAVLIFCLSFFVKEYFIKLFLFFFFLLKLCNIVSIMGTFGDWEYNYTLDYVKVFSNVALWGWFGLTFCKFVKGWSKESYIE